MDGLLVIDKPVGPTSHDIVSRVRRLLDESRVGHTGTLDPMASGVLPLVIGRATRLARFLSSSDKRYLATVRFGRTTDTCDAAGTPVGQDYDGPWPTADEIESALDRYRGEFMQQPPAFSAKKIGGTRSYKLARNARKDGLDTAAEPPPLPAPALVRTSLLRVAAVDDGWATIEVGCSAGFYVRSLAHDLGRDLGIGGHLAALRRTEAAGFDLTAAVPLDMLEGPEGRLRTGTALLAMEEMLPELPRVTLTPQGIEQVKVGRDIGPRDALDGFPATPDAAPRRLCREDGSLVAIAEGAAAPGFLHPAVVLM